MTVSLVVHVLMSVQWVQFLKAKSIRSTLMLAQSVEHVQMFVQVRLSAFHRKTHKRNWLNFSGLIKVRFFDARSCLVELSRTKVEWNLFHWVPKVHQVVLVLTSYNLLRFSNSLWNHSVKICFSKGYCFSMFASVGNCCFRCLSIVKWKVSYGVVIDDLSCCKTLAFAW